MPPDQLHDQTVQVPLTLYEILYIQRRLQNAYEGYKTVGQEIAAGYVLQTINKLKEAQAKLNGA